MQSRFCGKCGTALRPQSKYCKICGEPVYIANAPAPILDSTIVDDSPAISPTSSTETTVGRLEPSQVKPDKHTQFLPTEGFPAAESKRRQSNSSCHRGGGSIVLAVLLCAVIFIWTFGAISLLDIRLSLSEQKIDKTISSVLNRSQLVKTPAYYIFPNISDRSQTIVEWAVEEINAAYENSIEITPEMAEDFLYDSTLLSFVIDELSDFFLDIRDSTGRSGVSASELQEFIEENLAEIEVISGEKLDVDDSHYIAKLLEDQGLLEYLEIQKMKDASPTVFNIIKFVLSYWAIGLFCLLSILFLILLAKCNRWNFWHTCGDIGVVLVMQGSILLLATAFAVWGPDIWYFICGTNRLWANLSGTVLENCVLPHAFILAIGALLCAIKIIWKKICQRRVHR